MKMTRERLRHGMAGWTRTLAWLAVAALSARLVFWLHGWLSPYGAVTVFYRGEAFERPRWVTCLRRLDFFCQGRPAPWVCRDHFSMRMKARLRVPRSAMYDFATLSDDGIRLKLDGLTLIDNWQPQDFYRSSRTTNVQLTAGFHDLAVEFFDAQAAARFRIEWCGGPIPPRTTLGPPYLYKPLLKDRW